MAFYDSWIRPGISSNESSQSVYTLCRPPEDNSVRNEKKAVSRQKTGADALSRRRISHSDLERKRRGDMKQMLMILESLLPNNSKRKKRRSKCAVLTESFAYISALKGQLDDLSRKRAQILSAESPRPKCNPTTPTGTTDHPTGTNPPTHQGADQPSPSAKTPFLTVEVHSCKSDFLITITTDSEAALLSRTLLALQENNIDVFNACLSRNGCNALLSVHAQPRAGAARGMTRDELRDELHKVAMAEIESGGGELMKEVEDLR